MGGSCTGLTLNPSHKQTLQMCDKYQRKVKSYHTPINSEEGVSCVQQKEVNVNTVPVILNKGGKTKVLPLW